MTVAAPYVWNAPSSGGTVFGTLTTHYVTYANGYWFSLASNSTTSLHTFRVATNPSQAWTTVSLPTAPTGYTNSGARPLESGVSFDGTTYAMVVPYRNGSLRKYRVAYATDPLGTWSAYEFDATDTYWAEWFGYLGGQWVMAGRYATASPQPAFIATAATANGTYAFNTSAATTGYNTADLSGTGTQYWEITGIGFDGTTYVTAADRNSGNTGVRYSTSLTSGWATPSSPPATSFLQYTSVRYNANGWWTLVGAGNNAYYTDTPSGTWTQLTATDVGLGDRFFQLAHADGYWVAVGAYDNAGDPAPRITYLAATGSPSGTYATAADGFTEIAFTGAILTGLAYGGGYWVAANNVGGELRYSNVAAVSTYLRQFQSPVRTPSRVRGVNLRQRQTPFIT